MDKESFNSIIDIYADCFMAILSIAVLTGVMVLIGRDTLGEAVIALLYLVPIGYCTTKWGQVSGICAAVSAALAFDFFFIPPFHTFTVGSLEGWLVLIIFLSVAILIIGRIQYGLSQAREREREAIFMYELTSALSGLRDPQEIALIMADQIQRMYLAQLVQVFLEGNGPEKIFNAPSEGNARGKPDRVIPIQAPQGFLGEIWIWAGKLPLPPKDSRLFQSFTAQSGLALERARRVQSGAHNNSLVMGEQS